MQWNSLVALALVAPSHALIRFGCSQLVVDRIDPLVNPGLAPSPHLHQIIGGVSHSCLHKNYAYVGRTRSTPPCTMRTTTSPSSPLAQHASRRVRNLEMPARKLKADI